MTTRRTRRAALLVGAIVLSVGLGGTAGFAAWTVTNSVSAPVTTATAATTLTGVSSLAVTYKPGLSGVVGATLAQTATVSANNTGTSPLTYTLASSGGTSALNALITVQVWPAASGCTAATTAPANTVSGTFTTLPTLPAAFNSATAGTTLSLCVRTSMTAANVTANYGATTTPTITLVGRVGTAWTANATATVTQSVANNRFQVLHTASGLCMDVTGGSTAEGTSLSLNTCATDARRTFTFTASETANYYTVRSGLSANVVLSGATLLNSSLGMRTPSLLGLWYPYERWQPMQHGPAGQYQLKNLQGLCLNVSPSTIGTQIGSAACGTSTTTTDATYIAQHFTLPDV